MGKKKSTILPDNLSPRRNLQSVSNVFCFFKFLRSNILGKLREYDYISLGTIEYNVLQGEFSELDSRQYA